MQFDSLASGDWNSELLVDGVQITNNASSRLWSLPDAFPNLRPSHGGKKAWGPCKYHDLAQPRGIDLASHKIIHTIAVS